MISEAYIATWLVYLEALSLSVGLEQFEWSRAKARRGVPGFELHVTGVRGAALAVTDTTIEDSMPGALEAIIARNLLKIRERQLSDVARRFT